MYNCFPHAVKHKSEAGGIFLTNYLHKVFLTQNVIAEIYMGKTWQFNVICLQTMCYLPAKGIYLGRETFGTIVLLFP